MSTRGSEENTHSIIVDACKGKRSLPHRLFSHFLPSSLQREKDKEQTTLNRGRLLHEDRKRDEKSAQHRGGGRAQTGSSRDLSARVERGNHAQASSVAKTAKPTTAQLT